jgi:hypothetical protein
MLYASAQECLFRFAGAPILNDLLLLFGRKTVPSVTESGNHSFVCAVAAQSLLVTPLQIELRLFVDLQVLANSCECLIAFAVKKIEKKLTLLRSQRLSDGIAGIDDTVENRPRVGPITPLTQALKVGDASRFRSIRPPEQRSVAEWIGLASVRPNGSTPLSSTVVRSLPLRGSSTPVIAAFRGENSRSASLYNHSREM